MNATDYYFCLIEVIILTSNQLSKELNKFLIQKGIWNCQLLGNCSENMHFCY